MHGPASHRHPQENRGALGMALEARHAGAKHAAGKGPQGQAAGRPALCIATRIHLRRASYQEASAPDTAENGAGCSLKWQRLLQDSHKGNKDKQRADKAG